MAFAGAAGTDDQYRCTLAHVAPGREVMQEGAVDVGQALEVELLEGLGGAKRCAAQTQCELLLLASGYLILDEQCEELGVGEFRIDRLAVTGVQLIEDARQAQLLQIRREFRYGVHALGSPGLRAMKQHGRRVTHGATRGAQTRMSAARGG